ncbi:MAG: outer membrane protein assembly factor BamA [Candidatus Rokuibacteriota bacterium]
MAALFAAGPAAAQAPAEPQRPILIKELAVEGVKRVQEAVVMGRVKSAIGSTFNPTLLSEDIRAIFSLGFFDDVQLRVEDFEGGVKVTFAVTERPFVRDVDFVGNKALKTDELQEKIDLKLGNVYNPVDVQRALDKLRDFYEDEGYFEVQITPNVEKFADGDVRVAFSVVEGRQIKIDKIAFKGNAGLKDSQIKDALATRERQFYILRGKVQRQRLDEDVERILALYNDNGYVQARVESTDVAVDRDRALVTVTFVIVEGPQFRVGAVKTTGITLLPEKEILRQVKFKSGDLFARSAIRESLTNIESLYSTIGRASADVAPKTEQVPGQHLFNVTFEIIEGPEVYVERINIAGNVRSQDKILRREIPLHEGDLYTLQKKERARQKLVNLGHFEKVEVTTQPGSDKTKIIVNVEVTERPTGIFSLGGGYSSVDALVGTIDLAQRNFLGRGWEASIRLRAGAQSQQGVISFTEPWLFDRPLAAGVDLFLTDRQFSDYHYNSYGAGLRTGHPFEEYWRWNVGYRASQDRINDLSDVAALSPELRSQVGTRVTSTISGGLGRDSRNNVTMPSQGSQANASVDFAGLGGDQRYVKTAVYGTKFLTIWLDHILAGRAEAAYGFGWSDKPLPVFERFYLGGPNSVRSFKFRELSPKDEQGVRTGGNSEVLGNLEYLVPLPLGFRIAGFFDIGQVYGFGSNFDLTELRKAAGPGVRWQSPFGPIRFDYGLNLDRRKGEKFGALQFSVGTPF